MQLACSNPKHFCFSILNTISTEMTGSKPKPGDNPSHPLHISIKWNKKKYCFEIISHEKLRPISGRCEPCQRYQLEDLRKALQTLQLRNSAEINSKNDRKRSTRVIVDTRKSISLNSNSMVACAILIVTVTLFGKKMWHETRSFIILKSQK